MECSLTCRRILKTSHDKAKILEIENKKLKNKIDLLEEEIKTLRDGIEDLFNNTMSLEVINKYELNNDKDIEVL